VKLPSLLLLCLALSAGAQSDFHALASTEYLLEGGQLEKLTVVTGNLQFNIRPPRDWSRCVDDAARRITFTSPSGQGAVTIQFTSNSPGTLPENDLLRTHLQQAHPGAGVYNTAVCPTSSRPGVFFDLAGVPAPHVVQKIRHAFVPGPSGVVEFVLSASNEEFDKDRLALMAMLGAFRVDPIKTRQP